MRSSKSTKAPRTVSARRSRTGSTKSWSASSKAEEGTTDDSGDVDGGVHDASCHRESGGNSLRGGRAVRHVAVEEVRRLDRVLSGDDGPDQRDRLLLSARSPAAVPYRRDPVARDPDGRDRGVLSLPSRGSLAAGLCRERRGGPLLERLRPGGPVVPQGAVPPVPGADPVRAPLSDRAARRPGA